MNHQLDYFKSIYPLVEDWEELHSARIRDVLMILFKEQNSFKLTDEENEFVMKIIDEIYRESNVVIKLKL